MSSKAPNPYVGPVPFTINDANRFYGREGDLRRLMVLFVAQRIVLLYSPSGAGKTSLVQAKMIPALERKGFEVLPVIRVNRRPLEESAFVNNFVFSTINSLTGEPAPQVDQDQVAEGSAGAAPDPGDSAGTGLELSQFWQEQRAKLANRRAVLFFDQFEEVLTGDPHDQEQKVRFFDQLGAILEEDDRLWALFAIREDYLAELDPFRHLIPGEFSSSYRLELLDDVQAMAAIQKPAADVDVTFEDEAAKKLVSQLRRVTVRHRDGRITFEEGPFVEPVQLQVVCQTLWEDLEPEVGGTISAASVAAEGHVDEALGKFYDKTVARIALQNNIDQRDIRNWFDRDLITEGGLRGQVMGSGNLLLSQDVIDDLVDAHLIRAEERRGIQWYELAHDRLVKPVSEHNNIWYENNLSLLQLRAEVWKKKQDDGSLLSGDELIDAQAWAENRQLKEHEEAFLEKSRTLERERKAKETRRRQLIMAGIAGILLVIGIAFVMYFLWQDAEDAKALANRRLARSLVTQGQAEYEEDPLLGLSLVLEGLALVDEKNPNIQEETLDNNRDRIFQWGRLSKLGGDVSRIENSPDELVMVIEQKNAPREVRHSTDGHLFTELAGPVRGVTFSPDKTAPLFIASYDNAPGEVRRTTDGQLIAELPGIVVYVEFSPDENSSIFVIGYSDAPDEVRHTADGQLIAELAGSVSKLTFSRDEDASYLFIEYRDVPGEVRRTVDGQLIAELEGERARVTFYPSENPSIFYVGYRDAPGEVRRTADGQLIAELARVGAKVIVSPDEDASFFFVNYRDAPGEVRRTADGQLIAELPGKVDYVEFSPDEDASLFVVQYEDAPGEVRRTTDGQLLFELPGDVSFLEFSPDEAASLLVIGYEDAPEEVRRTSDGQLITGLAGVVRGVEFIPDEAASLFVIRYEDAPGEVHRTSDGQLITELAGEVRGVEFIPDEAASLFVIHYEDAPGEVRHTSDGQLITELAGEVRGVEFIPDEAASLFVIHYEDAPGEVRRTSDGQLITELAGSVRWVEFSPDEDASLLVIGYEDAPGEVRRTSDGQLITKLAGLVRWVEFSPDEDASLFVSGYEDAPAEVRYAADGQLLFELPHFVRSVRFSPDEAVSFLVVESSGGRFDLLSTDDGVRWLASLGNNVADTIFSPTNEVLTVRHENGRTYLLDLEWLQAMNGRVDDLSVAELVQYACEGPLSRGLDDEEIRSYLQAIGIDEPQACR